MIDAALANDPQLVSVFDHQFHDTLITLSNHTSNTEQEYSYPQFSVNQLEQTI